MRFLRLFTTILFVFVTSTIYSTVIPVDLRCDFWVNPKGIDVSKPVLSWTIKASTGKRVMRQTAYELIVASSIEMLNRNKGDMWNSGKVPSDKMGQIEYEGKQLKSSQQYWWKIKVWDENGAESAWSAPAQWTMGLLNVSDWEAKWISAVGAEKYAHQYKSAKSDFNLKHDLAEFRQFSPKAADTNYSSMLLRKEFSAAPKLKRAVVHVSGLGQYELFINGSKIGDYILAPGWSYYPKTVLYDTYDVTAQIKTG
ncbi:MAG TPA: alpha-L-rhamnosidase N-terminal domain-containing protein, partial [Paludibacter sp.]